MHADADKQGLVQGMITGMRGLCNGLGPAMFGLIFTLFHVDLTEKGEPRPGDYPPRPVPPPVLGNGTGTHGTPALLGLNDEQMELVTHIVPGPPFVFGSLLVILALMVSAFIPESLSGTVMGSGSANKRGSTVIASAGSPPVSVLVNRRQIAGSSEKHRRIPLSDEDAALDSCDERDFTVPLIHTTDPSL